MGCNQDMSNRKLIENLINIIYIFQINKKLFNINKYNNECRISPRYSNDWIN